MVHSIAKSLNDFIYKHYYYTSDQSEEVDEDNMKFYEMMLHEIKPKGYAYQEFIVDYFTN